MRFADCMVFLKPMQNSKAMIIYDTRIAKTGWDSHLQLPGWRR